MKLREHAKIAVIAGVLIEAILIAPLYLAWYTHLVDSVPLPFWILALEQLQLPGGFVIDLLLHTEAVRRFRAPIPIIRGLLIAAEVSVPLIQAVVLSLGAFGGLLLQRSRVARHFLASGSGVLWLALGPPALLLLLAVALTFPYWIDPDWAQFLTIVSCVWLVLATLFAGIPLAVARFRPTDQPR